MAKEAIVHAEKYAFRDRRKKKSEFRKLWQIKINASSRQAAGLSYSVLINKLKKADVALNRKILAELAEKQPEVFEKIIKHAA
jgi:large subunit ribosomal protein L20